MRSGVAAVAAAALVALGGCARDEEKADERYPDEAVANFVRECAAQAGASEAACRCMIDQLQRTMPYEEFKEADAALAENREPDAEAIAELEAAAERCRRS